MKNTISASRVSLCASYKTDFWKVRILSYLSCPWKIVSRVATFICYMALLIQTLRARIYYENAKLVQMIRQLLCFWWFSVH